MIELLRISLASPASESLPLLTSTPLRHQTPSASTRLTGCAKRPQPSHDVSDSHIPHLRILSILCQQDVALVHRDKKAGSLFRNQIAADCSLRLSPPQSCGDSFLPGIEDGFQPLAELFVQRRHLLRQIDEGTTTLYIFWPNGCRLDNADQSIDRVLAPVQRTQPVVLGEFCDDLLDDGISEIFLAIEMVVQRSLGDIGGSQNRIDAGIPESRSVDLPKTRLQQALPRALWITQSSLLIPTTEHTN